MDSRLLVPATRALLEGWWGPGVYVGHGHRIPVLVGREWVGDTHYLRTIESLDGVTACYVGGCEVDRLALDLAKIPEVLRG